MIDKYKIFIFTEDPDILVRYYTDVLGFNIVNKLEYDLDYGYTLETCNNGMQIWLARHSEVRGKNKDKKRHIINFYTDNLEEMYEKVKSSPLTTIVAKPFSMGEIIPGEERRAFTIFDPEDNCLQFMEKR